MGTETRLEVDGPIKEVMGKGTVGAPDGSRAFHGALRDAGKPCLTGVNHMKKIFTPVSKILKSSLDVRTNRMLKSKVGKTSKKKKSAVAETARYYKLPAGDNSAECTIGCSLLILRPPPPPPICPH